MKIKNNNAKRSKVSKQFSYATGKKIDHFFRLRKHLARTGFNIPEDHIAHVWQNMRKFCFVGRNLGFVTQLRKRCHKRRKDRGPHLPCFLDYKVAVQKIQPMASGVVEQLADYLRSPDPANHILAATIASDSDFIAAVQVLVDEAEEVFANGFFYLLDVFVSSEISLMVFEAGDERFMTYVPNKDHLVFNSTAIHHPDTTAAALRIKKILCQ